jgi:hypothetical protein
LDSGRDAHFNTHEHAHLDDGHAVTSHSSREASAGGCEMPRTSLRRRTRYACSPVSCRCDITYDMIFCST